MNSLKLYLELTRIVFGNNNPAQTQQEMLLQSFKDSLTCRRCQNLLCSPQTMKNCMKTENCVVCENCINNSDTPAVNCCLSGVHEPNNQIAILLKLYKGLCDYLEEQNSKAVVEEVMPAVKVCVAASNISEIATPTIGTVLAEVIDQEENSYVEELSIYTIKKEIEDIDLIQPHDIKIEEIDQFMSFSPSPPPSLPSPVLPVPIKMEPQVKILPPVKQMQRKPIATLLPTIKTEVQPIMKYQQHQQQLLTNIQRTATTTAFGTTKILTTTIPKSSPQSLLQPKIMVSTASPSPQIMKTYSQKPMQVPITKTLVTQQSHMLKSSSSPKPMFNLSKNFTSTTIASAKTPVLSGKTPATFHQNLVQLQKNKNSTLVTSTATMKPSPIHSQQLINSQKAMSKINIISIERTTIPTNFTVTNTTAPLQQQPIVVPATTNTTFNSQIQAPIKTVSNGSTMYQVMYNGSGNKITIKRKIDPDETKSYGGSSSSGSRDVFSSSSSSTPTTSGSGMAGGGNNGFKKPINQAKMMKPIIKRRGCRCGCATATPGKLTCCGQRCPCYVDSKSCIDCKCRGCRNPHRADGLKVRPLIPELENLEINQWTTIDNKPVNFQYTNNSRLNVPSNAFSSSNNNHSNSGSSSSNISSSSSTSAVNVSNHSNNSITTNTTICGNFDGQSSFTCSGTTSTTSTITVVDPQPQFQQFTTMQQQPRIIQQPPSQYTTMQSTGQLLYEQPMKSILQPQTTIPVTDDTMMFNTNNIQVLGVYTTHNSQLDPQSLSDVVLLDDPSTNQFLQLYPGNQINQIIYDEKPQQHFIMDGSTSDDNE